MCEQLGACSDEEIQAQLHQLTFAQPKQLVQSVRLLLHSSQYIERQRVTPAPAATKPVPATASVLSAREQEVLAMLARGLTMPQIGEQLFISPATVNNHCARMREKLGLRGRNALVLYAMKVSGNNT